MGLSLLSSSSRVETPFIIVEIAGYTFGNYSWKESDTKDAGGYRRILSKFPNYMTSLTIEKLNGTVNTYTLNMVYAIREGNDPNLLEKVFSKAKKDRTIKLSYGDLSLPSYIYKEEEAIITDIKSNIDVNSSVIRYTLTCTSKALSLAAGTEPFVKKFAKPSDIIEELLYNEETGLLEVFYGMRDREKVLSKGLLAKDDKPVEIEMKSNMTYFDYLSYLVSCMTCISDEDNSLKRQFRYSLLVRDDVSSIWGGPYFEIKKTTNYIDDDTLDTYGIDIGFPGENMVLNFSLDDNQYWSILSDYSGKIEQQEYDYRINDKGEIEGNYSPVLAKSDALLKTTEAEKTYWSTVTQYPVTGTITIKGLLRPAILMSYIKLNVYFYGQRHISSGYYMVVKQTDVIDSNGYRTTLKISRVKGSGYDN